MKLTLTTKFFPKTLKAIRKLPIKDADKLIKKYSLDGLKGYSSKENRVVPLIKNSVDHSSAPALDAVKSFDNRLGTSNNFQINFDKTSPLMDNTFYEKLDQYVTDYLNVKPNVLKYVNKDKVISDQLKHGILKGFRVETSKFMVINLYHTSGFIVSMSKLENIVMACYEANRKYLNKTLTPVMTKSLYHDATRFRKYVEPALPFLMEHPAEYRRALKHKRLLYDIAQRLSF